MHAHPEDAARARRSARTVAGLQWTIIVCYLFGAMMPLLTAAIDTGDYAGMADPGLDRYGDPMERLPSIGPELTAVIAVLSLTPYGIQLRQWLVD
jgi:hypothetical protein